MTLMSTKDLSTAYRRLATFAVVAATTLGAAATASAHEEPKNLKVLAPGKELEPAMKQLTKGLGVKCNACHVKGKFDSDEIPAKEATRKFLTATVGEKDQAKRDPELKTLLEALKLKEAKDSAEIWKAVDAFKKK